jgi:hypothetical protein
MSLARNQTKRIKDSIIKLCPLHMYPPKPHSKSRHRNAKGIIQESELRRLFISSSTITSLTPQNPMLFLGSSRLISCSPNSAFSSSTSAMLKQLGLRDVVRLVSEAFRDVVLYERERISLRVVGLLREEVVEAMEEADEERACLVF